MTPEEAKAERWKFSKEPKLGCSLNCVYCKAVSPLSEWTKEWVECDLCDGHETLTCPVCGDGVDGYNNDSTTEVIYAEGQ